MSQILSAYKQGYKAHKEGKTLRDNPFTKNHISNHNEVQWDKGYRDAEKLSRDKNNNYTSNETL